MESILSIKEKIEKSSEQAENTDTFVEKLKSLPDVIEISSSLISMLIDDIIVYGHEIIDCKNYQK